MKKTIYLLAVLFLIGKLSNAQGSYGAKVDEKKAITMQDLTKSMTGKEEMTATVTGTVATVCQAEGCWMKMDKGDGTSMMVRMKDHKFFLPKDITGKVAVITGTAKVKTTTVEMLKHYAEDEGKSADYIATITEPKTELAFDAVGVTIK